MAHQFSHTCYRVLNLEKSIRFYEDVLGFKEASRKTYPEGDFSIVYLTLPEDDGYELELTYNHDQNEPYELGTGYGHIAIEVDDIKEVHDACVESKYKTTEIQTLPHVRNELVTFFMVTDPDGYKTQVIQKISR